jgi:ABC-type sugar transport system ATPase subunit
VAACWLKLDGLSKSFSGSPALKAVDLELGPGEVLGLVGENGAGKSTLIKILSGVYQPDAGQIQWLGRLVRFATPRDALDAGIATIHQELASFGHLTVAENLLMGQAWPRTAFGGINWRRLYADAVTRLHEFELDIPPGRLFRELSAAQRQEIAIVRALSRQARLLILDEPTASLSGVEVAQLFAHLERLRRSGKAVIYVSHRLDEILRLTDRVAVLRDGELVGQYATNQATIPRLVRDMVGRPLDQVYPRTRGQEIGPSLLELSAVSCAGMFDQVSLRVCAGEIVGLAGLVGSGRSELARAVFGLYEFDSGEMLLHGRPWLPHGAPEALKNGLIYIPEERKRQGFVLDHSVHDAIAIGFSDLLTRWGLVPVNAGRSRVKQVIDTYGVRARSATQPIGSLSGGNQQKSLLGRWLERDPSIVILDEPTRGVDVGAKGEIHSTIDRLAACGKAVLLISSDLPEVLGMSDRVLVMHRGRIAAELSGPALTQENVILAASGLLPATKAHLQ